MFWFIACAIYNLVFGIFHLTFWRLLDWKSELKKVSSNNRAVMQTLNLCLTFMFFLVAYIYLFHREEIALTSIGKVLSLGMLFFWVLRTTLQIVFFNLKKRVHQVLLMIFVLGIALHTTVFFI